MSSKEWNNCKELAELICNHVVTEREGIDVFGRDIFFSTKDELHDLGLASVYTNGSVNATNKTFEAIHNKFFDRKINRAVIEEKDKNAEQIKTNTAFICSIASLLMSLIQLILDVI